MTAKPEHKPMGGARPGAGRTQTTYKISVEAARKLQAIAKQNSTDPSGALEALINRYYSETLNRTIENKPLSDVEKLLNTLRPSPEPVANIYRQLNWTRAQLEQTITKHRAELEQAGIRLYVATHSEASGRMEKYITIEGTRYRDLSRELR